MNKNERKFAIPFNGSNADSFIQFLQPYIKNIDQVYLGIPTFLTNHQNVGIINNYTEILNYEYNCYNFLSKTINAPYKRLLTLNSPTYNINYKDYYLFVHQRFYDIINNFKIDGVIIADFCLGKAIRTVFPDLEIQTSCNSYMWNIEQMQRWKDELGVEVFNPPREILRTRKALEEMHNAGFKLKCIVNESCIYGCPENQNHATHIANNNDYDRHFCDVCDISNFLKGNWILPRHLKLFDELVDVYKIVGRCAPTQWILNAVKSYINEKNDKNFHSIIVGRICSRLEGMNIPIKLIPDKILTCECRDCSSCKICDKITEHIFKINGKVYNKS